MPNEVKYLNIHRSRWQIFWNNLIGGIAWGLGSVIGATIVVGILGFLLIQFRHIPFLGDLVNVITDTIESGQPDRR